MTFPLGPLERLDQRQHALLTIAALVVIAYGIRAAASLLQSLLLALLLTVAVLPAFETLRRRGVSKGIATALTSVLLVLIAVALLGFLAVSGTQLVQVLPTYQEKVEALRQTLIATLSARGIDPDQVLSLDLISPTRVLGMAAGVLSGAGKVLSQALLLILIVAFILVETGSRGEAIQPGGRLYLITRDVRQYLLITAATGFGFAVVCYILMLSVGTDLALVWAVFAFVMNFVPSVGIILSVIPPMLLTLLEYGWTRALVILGSFLVLNFFIDNVLKPRFMQSGLDVSPLVGLLSLVVWGFLLGPTGALLALPLTIAIRRLLRDPPPLLPPPPPELPPGPAAAPAV
ncbi:MAG TPA: AI-2E family transporter [Gemmatimonadales bacterium]|nr:AI-2E family transporter [Gemmatimonadales bacterium]